MVNLRHTAAAAIEKDQGFPCATCGKVYADMIVAELCRRKGCAQRKAKRGHRRKKKTLEAAAAAAGTGAAATDDAGRWKQAKAPNGKAYYYNTVTKESRWSMPPSAAAAASPAQMPRPASSSAGLGAGAGERSSGGDIILAWVGHALRRGSSTPSYTALKSDAVERFGEDLWNTHKEEIKGMLMRVDGLDPDSLPPPAPAEELYYGSSTYDEYGQHVEGISDGWDNLENGGSGGGDGSGNGDGDGGDDWIFVIDHDFAEARAAVGGGTASGGGGGGAPVASSAPPCWVCRGSGHTSKWLGAAAVKAAAEKMAEEDWGKAYQCSLCAEDGQYGMSVSCGKHFYCGSCLASTIAGAFAKKQFPPHCPQCFLDADGETTKVGVVDDAALSFLYDCHTF